MSERTVEEIVESLWEDTVLGEIYDTRQAAVDAYIRSVDTWAEAGMLTLAFLVAQPVNPIEGEPNYHVFNLPADE